MKVSILSFVLTLLLINVWNLSPLMTTQSLSASTLPAPDFYSGRDDLTTIGLGRSAYTEDGRNGVGVNIYRKSDGSYVVQVIEHAIVRGRQRSTVSKEYVKAWRDKEDRICFMWKNREYRTGPQIL